MHAVAGTSAAFARGGWIWGGRSDGKVNTDVAARKRRLPANANVARGAWRPWESRRHGADIVPHLVNEEEEGDRASVCLHGNPGNLTRNARGLLRGRPRRFCFLGVFSIDFQSPICDSASREDRRGEIKMANGGSRRMLISTPYRRTRSDSFAADELFIPSCVLCDKFQERNDRDHR